MGHGFSTEFNIKLLLLPIIINFGISIFMILIFYEAKIEVIFIAESDFGLMGITMKKSNTKKPRGCCISGDFMPEGSRQAKGKNYHRRKFA